MILLKILAVPIVGIMWRIGGSGKKWVRLIGVPLILGTLLLELGWLNGVCYSVGLWIMLALFSYGLTSPVHRFWVWLLKTGNDGNVYRVEFWTRLTCAFFWILPAVIIIGNPSIFACVFPVTMFGLVKDVDISEIGIGMVISLSVLI